MNDTSPAPLIGFYDERAGLFGRWTAGNSTMPNDLHISINENELGFAQLASVAFSGRTMTSSSHLAIGAEDLLSVNLATNDDDDSLSRRLPLRTSRTNSNSKAFGTFKSSDQIHDVNLFGLVQNKPVDFDTLNSPVQFADNSNQIASKQLRLDVSSKTRATSKQHRMFSVRVRVEDVNDNAPVISQPFFHVEARSRDSRIYANNASVSRELLQFDVSDTDQGRFGSQGVYCFLMGDGHDKYARATT